MSENAKNFVTPAAYMILKREGEILLARRCNTGYEDGNYQPPAGHIEPGELPLDAAIREAKEEVGVDINRADVQFAHVTYPSNEDGLGHYVDFFFMTERWDGEPHIAEPDKCDELLWTRLDALPENTVTYVRDSLERMARGEFYSEYP